jgi:hypothetical protein
MNFFCGPRNDRIVSHFRAIFTSACSFVAAVNIDDRKEGFWNRSVLAGVRTAEILFALVIITAILMAATFIGIAIGLFLSDIRFNGSLMLLSMFYFLLSWCGIMFGLCLGATCRSLMFTSSLTMFLGNYFSFLIGGF